jgi:hypothetical protein
MKLNKRQNGGFKPLKAVVSDSQSWSQRHPNLAIGIDPALVWTSSEEQN